MLRLWKRKDVCMIVMMMELLLLIEGGKYIHRKVWERKGDKLRGRMALAYSRWVVFY